MAETATATVGSAANVAVPTPALGETKTASASVPVSAPPTSPAPIPAAAVQAASSPPAAAATAPLAETKYELKAPEGVTLGKAESDGYTAFAKARGLTNDQLNALVERDYAGMKANHERLVGQLDQTDKEWLGALQANKEYGGEKFNETVLTVKKVYDRFDPSGGFRKALEAAKLAHNPELFWFVHQIGRSMADDKAFTVPSAPYAPGKVDPMTALKAAYSQPLAPKK